MAMTSGKLVAGKALASQGGNGRNGRMAKLAAGVAVLGCAAALAFGGLKSADHTLSQAHPTAAPINVALAQSLAGNGFLELLPGEATVGTDPVRGVPTVARTRTLAGAGFIEYLPGEEPSADRGEANPSFGPQP